MNTEPAADTLIYGLQAATSVIDGIIARNVRDDDTLDIMSRNIRHIDGVCKIDALAGEDLEPFREAQARGSAWLRV